MENFPWGRSNVWEREGAHSDSGSGPGEERGVKKVMWLCLLICEVPPPHHPTVASVEEMTWYEPGMQTGTEQVPNKGPSLPTHCFRIGARAAECLSDSEVQRPGRPRQLWQPHGPEATHRDGFLSARDTPTGPS